MNTLRTEDDLRAAFAALSEDAPAAADVLPVADQSGRMRRRWLARAAPIAVAAAVVGIAVGISRSGNSSPAATAGNVRQLVAVHWKVRTIDGASPGEQLFLRIEPNGRFQQSTFSCTGLDGTLALSQAALSVEKKLTPSYGFCPMIRRNENELIARFMGIFRKVFAGSISWSLVGNRLTLRNDGAPTVVYERYGAPVPLRQWTYHGVGISVPRSWPTDAEHCGTPMQNTVIVHHDGLQCLVMPAPRVTAVAFDAGGTKLEVPDQIGEVSHQLIDGVATTQREAAPRTGPYAGLHVAQVRIPSRNVLVTISAPSSEQTENLVLQLYIVDP